MKERNQSKYIQDLLQFCIQKRLFSSEMAQKLYEKYLEKVKLGQEINILSLAVEMGFLSEKQAQQLETSFYQDSSTILMDYSSLTKTSSKPLLSLSERYKIEKELGRGGMGVVYLAYDQQLRRKVALKKIHLQNENREEAKERFLREAQLAATLSHPHIVQVYDIGEIDNQLYCVMEYIEGSSAAEWIQEKGPMDEKRALEILIQIGEAVAYAHDKGIIHRDIKGENILIDKSGKAYLADFGLAKRMEGPSFTQTGAIMGTPAFMAPEQAFSSKDATFASDVYSLGGVLFYLLTGRFPFQGEDSMSILMKVVRELPPLLSEVRVGLSREVEGIVEKCLEKNPKNRYASAKDLVADLKALYHGYQPAYHEPFWKVKIRRFWRSHPYLWLGGAIVLLVIVSGVIFSWMQRKWAY
ncbi:MAG: serine/threonine protein kinase, partial [Planctomycetota bacterium]